MLQFHAASPSTQPTTEPQSVGVFPTPSATPSSAFTASPSIPETSQPTFPPPATTTGNPACALTPQPNSENPASAARCSSPYQNLHTAVNFSTGFQLSSLASQPGYERLNPLTPGNVDFFSHHWTFLWQCACAVLQQTTKVRSYDDAIKRISLDHFPAQGDDETMGAFFSRLLTAYTHTKNDLAHLKLAHRLPDPDSLIDLVQRKASRVSPPSTSTYSTTPSAPTPRTRSPSRWFKRCTSRLLNWLTVTSPASRTR